MSFKISAQKVIASILLIKHRRNNRINLDKSCNIKLYKCRFKGGNFIGIGRGSLLLCDVLFEKPEASLVIGQNVYVGPETVMAIAGDLMIGSNVQIAWKVTILDHNSHSLNYLERRKDLANTIAGHKDWSDVRQSNITIGDDVWIGFGATIMKGVTLGQGCVIGANAVVVQSVPPFTVVAGNPAKVVKNLKEFENENQ